jgi:hypothetical protein
MRRIFFSIPAFALACATSSPNQQLSGTRRAQDDAQQQYQGAASAQKHAAEEQQKAEQAERDVTKAQKVLADAQSRLDGQRAKAAQAQRDAGQTGRDAQQRGAQMQENATQLQGLEARQGKRTEQGNERAWMQTQNISGAVAAVGADGLTVRSADRGDVKLELSNSTAVNLDGRTASIAEVHPGNQVRASYGVIDGRSTATQIDVSSTSETPARQ